MSSSFLITEDASFSPLVQKPMVTSREEDSSLPYRLLTFGEETEGAGFSPSVKKPMTVTKGEREEEREQEKEHYETVFSNTPTSPA